jgi:hypothetical protein
VDDVNDWKDLNLNRYQKIDRLMQHALRLRKLLRSPDDSSFMRAQMTEVDIALKALGAEPQNPQYHDDDAHKAWLKRNREIAASPKVATLKPPKRPEPNPRPPRKILRPVT